MKYFVYLTFLMVLFAGVVRADDSSIVVDVTATTCFDCLPQDDLNGPIQNINMEAQLTLQLVSGDDAYNSFFQTYMVGSEVYEIVAATGENNGIAFTLAAPEPGSIYWVDFFPQVLQFTDGESLGNDDSPFEWDSGTPVEWTYVQESDPTPQIAIAAPEPGVLTLLLAGLFALIKIGKRG